MRETCELRKEIWHVIQTDDVLPNDLPQASDHMKQPRPSAPVGAPEGTVQLGGPIDWFSASLQVSGDDLDPEQITRLLEHAPTRAQRRGVPLRRPDGTARVPPRFGRWARDLKPSQTDEWDISEVIRLLFEGLPLDLAVWDQVAALGRTRMAFGLNMPTSNREFELEPDLMRFLAARRVSVWFDIYCEQEEA